MYLNVNDEEMQLLLEGLDCIKRGLVDRDGRDAIDHLADVLMDQDNMQKLTNAEKITFLTNTRNLTVKQLAAKAHLTAFHFNQILAGKRNGGNMTTKFLNEMLLDRSE
jgi:hypothetical protein